jgi:hypothetical protein
MKTRLVLWTVGLVTLMYQTSVYASSASAEGSDSIVVMLSVSAQQEENFRAFTNWLGQHASLKHNTSFSAAHTAVFAALKKNDASAYFAAIALLDSASAKLSTQEQQDMYNFFISLPAPEGKMRPVNGENGGGGACEVECLFGSCRITCPSGTKPKCFCQWGQPHCGCEPYGQR